MNLVAPSIALAVILFAFAAQCTAAPLAIYDGFNYSPVGSAITGQSGGGDTGWNGAWGGSTSSNFTIGSGSLIAPVAVLPSSGNMLSTGSSGSNKDTSRAPSVSVGAPGTTEYFSFLLQPEGTVGQGLDDGHLGLVLIGDAGSLYIGKPGVGAANPNLYDLETLGGTGRVPTSVSAVSGQTVLMVLKADFTAGADTFSLYINPVGPIEALTPNAIKSDLNLGSLTLIQIGGPGAFNIDELRMGSTYGSVVPEPSSFLLAAFGVLALLAFGRRRFR